MSFPQQWAKAYEVDFSTLATSGAKFSNGAITLDGKSWFVENTANATTFQITNGSGLIIAPNTNASNFFGTTRTAPLVVAKVNDLVAGLTLDVAQRIRVWINFSLANVNQTFEIGGGGFENYRAATGGTYNATIKRGFNSVDFWQAVLAIDGGNQESQTTTNLSHDVMMIEFEPYWRCAYYTGTLTSGAFPSKPAMTRRGTTAPTIDSNAKAAAYGGLPDVNALSIVLYAFNSASLGNMIYTVKKLRIDYLIGDA